MENPFEVEVRNENEVAHGEPAEVRIYMDGRLICAVTARIETDQNGMNVVKLTKSYLDPV